ncbi:DUF4874 domain-containing protein [Lacticaseibacillus rhamnosus]|uniref:DUF4874 domain-containing protein n=1 Tax=Lacticaseibacillus rhamnosus TaxID=47715 RepID=UPI0023E1010B|nr:DUF4874 domain-containing protein [Lacticaseibacillus rhamnosus]MDF3335696.1 DUF4874 domain-containing protein [Lacticaseibacillus rhamnosus]
MMIKSPWKLIFGFGITVVTAAIIIGLGFQQLKPSRAETVIPVTSLSGDKTKNLLTNTNRGLRLEVNMDVKSGMGLWGNANKTGVQELKDTIALYQDEQPQLAQVYFYLTGYKTASLDQTAFNNMNDYFKVLKQYNIKAVLRFAYIWDDGQPRAQEPTTDQVVAHIKQLAPFIKDHQNQIAVLQAGLIGAWGEWDSGARSRMNEKVILNELLSNTPSDMFVQVRYLNIKNNNIDPKNQIFWNRVGFHDDYLIGTPHVWNSAGADTTGSLWQQMAHDSLQAPVDGEMIWGSANASTLSQNQIAAKLLAQRLAEHHFTSLSLTHNYKEDGQAYSMAFWQHQYINRKVLSDAKLPFQESWFEDKSGQPIAHTWFDYIRDYLGYRIAVTNARVQPTEGSQKVILTLKNYGFAAPLLTTQAQVVLLDDAKNIIASRSIGNLADLQSMSSIEATAAFTTDDYQRAHYLAFKFSGLDGQGNRLANELEFTGGYNIIQQME